MGIFSALGGLFGIGGDKKAISKAANAQNAALDKGIAQISGQQTANTQAFQPYTEAGGGATNSIATLLGLGNPEDQQAAIEALKASPYFTGKYDTGIEAILQNASATGGLRGGNTQDSLARFGSGLLDDTIQSQIANLFGLSNQGFNAASTGAQLNTGLSGGIAQMLGMQGDNTASSILGQRQATNKGINGLLGHFDANMQMAGQAMTGMPSGGSSSAGGGIMNLLKSLF